MLVEASECSRLLQLAQRSFFHLTVTVTFSVTRKAENSGDFLSTCYIQLFQLTLSVQKHKAKRQDRNLRGIFMNKLIKISHAWRKQ